METLELIVNIEAVVNLFLIVVVLAYAFLRREQLYSEKARRVMREDLGMIRLVVIFLMLSVFLYLAGEVAVLLESFNVLLPFSLTYDELHEGAEAVHLFLLFVGYVVGGVVLAKAVRSNGA